MIQVTSGDIMHMMGGFGLGLDYTVRMKLRLADEIDDDILPVHGICGVFY